MHATIVGKQLLEIRKCGKKSKILHSFPVQCPNVLIEPISTDPKSDDFLGFRLINQTTKKELDRFRTDDVVQMRLFMASLGSSGIGIFSSQPPPTLEAEEAYWASITPQQANKPIMHYEETILELPTEFYFAKKPSSINIITSESVGSMTTPFSKPLPLYDPQKSMPPSKRRPWNDTFRAPVGPAVYVPVSMGYGEEVGLQIGQQAVWDPFLKTCVTLDHNTKERINNDLRKPHKNPMEVTKKTLGFQDRHDSSLKSKYNVCKDTNVLLITSKQAYTKPHGLVLNASERDGSFGYDGRPGACGADGHPGSCGARKQDNGYHGGNGWPGNPGAQGLNGQAGANASDVVLFLDGNLSELKVSGSCKFSANLGGKNNEEVLFVNCRGGNGGKGGNGGNGGAGGNGGRGGDGAPGRQGVPGRPHCKGGDGGPGGNGGNGGNGGSGGCGGIGGNGGNAGAGGTCVICAADPKLLMLVEVDALSGDVGKGGTGGRGGGGGNGGIEGYGGPGGPGGKGASLGEEFLSSDKKLSNAPGCDGQNGNPGRRGACGSQGSCEKDGSSGQPAPHGSIAWVICSKEGKPMQQAGTRYDIQVKSYQVTSENNDNIFEPNERIAISDIIITNVGGLPLPAGAEVMMEKTKSDTINFEPIRFTLPEIQPGKSMKVPTTFYGRINDRPPPNTPGAVETTADFMSRVEVLGRPFSKSCVLKKLDIKYPVKLKLLRCNENVGRGEVTIFEIQMENISTQSYGTCQGSAGEVGIKIHMDARLIPVAQGNAKDKSIPYNIMYDSSKQDSLYIQVSSIQPKETLTMHVAIQMDSEAELFDYCRWQADLCLRGKVVEYNFEKIRISPIYIPRDPPGDVLMVTSPDISRSAFILWERIFQILGCTVDYWDTIRYQGFSVDNSTEAHHSVTWLGRYCGKMILFPHCSLQLLRGSHIVQHFHSELDKRSDLGSSMVVLLPPSPPLSIKSERFQDLGDVSVLQHLVSVDCSLPLPKGGYGGKHMTAPNSAEPYLKWEQQTLEQKEKEEPSNSVFVLSRQTNIESKGAFKYSYGEVDIRRCPLKRSCKFVLMDGHGGSITQIGEDDPNISGLNLTTTEDIPIATNFGQTLLHTLYGLSINVKLMLIKDRSSSEERGDAVHITFSLPNGILLTLGQLSAICLAYEIADEVLGCSKSLLRANSLLEDVLANKPTYSSKAELISQLLDLTERELQERKKKFDLSATSAVIKEAKKVLGRIQQAIREPSRRASKSSQIVVLPSLSVLQNTSHTHRSHQYIVKDDRWNLMCK